MFKIIAIIVVILIVLALLIRRFYKYLLKTDPEYQAEVDDLHTVMNLNKQSNQIAKQFADVYVDANETYRDLEHQYNYGMSTTFLNPDNLDKYHQEVAKLSKQLQAQIQKLNQYLNDIQTIKTKAEAINDSRPVDISRFTNRVNKLTTKTNTLTQKIKAGV